MSQRPPSSNFPALPAARSEVRSGRETKNEPKNEAMSSLRAMFPHHDAALLSDTLAACNDAQAAIEAILAWDNTTQIHKETETKETTPTVTTPSASEIPRASQPAMRPSSPAALSPRSQHSHHESDAGGDGGDGLERLCAIFPDECEENCEDALRTCKGDFALAAETIACMREREQHEEEHKEHKEEHKEEQEKEKEKEKEKEQKETEKRGMQSSEKKTIQEEKEDKEYKEDKETKKQQEVCFVSFPSLFLIPKLFNFRLTMKKKHQSTVSKKFSLTVRGKVSSCISK